MSDAKTPNATIISGRFGPGNKAAAGRQSRGQKLRSAIMASISRADVEAITRTLVEQAKAGDQGAAKILLGFIGKPTEGPCVAIQVNNQGQTSSESRERARVMLDRLKAHLSNCDTPPDTTGMDAKSAEIVQLTWQVVQRERGTARSRPRE